jgi:hypothetical protein
MPRQEKTLTQRLRERGKNIDEAVDAADPGSAAPSEPSEPAAEPATTTTTTTKPATAAVGRDNSAENAKVLNAQLSAKLAAAEAAGNTDLAEKLKARQKAINESE